ncbi:MAG: ABC transporter permease subunit [Sideroxydans sp.]|nr:ABC transporter permease subunit [Sideroxydans sp.]
MATAKLAVIAPAAAERRPAFGRWPGVLALLPFFAVLLAFCLVPAAWVLISSKPADGGMWYANFAEILSSPFYRQAFGNSLDVSLWSSLAGLVIAVVGVASLRRVPGRLRSAAVAFTNMSSNLSGVPLAFAFIILLGTNGTLTLILRHWGWIDDAHLYSLNGLILIYAYFQIPLGVLVLYPAFDALDDDWQHAASQLGAGPFSYWWHVGLPVLAPALAGTFILLFANAMGAYASAFALTAGNVNLVTIRIASLVAGDIFLQPDLAAALAVLLMALLALVTAVNHWLLNRSYRGD